jgi:hypothetical protein
MKYGDISVVGDFFKYDEDAILQKIELLLKSLQGDWFFDRDFECDLREFLFQPLSEYLVDDIHLSLLKRFKKHIPEIKILGTTNVSLNYDLRCYSFELDFSIPGIDRVYRYENNLEITQI